MDNIEYPNFKVETVNSNITVDNFYKQDYVVFSVDNMYMFTIYRTFVDMCTAERLPNTMQGEGTNSHLAFDNIPI